MKNFNPRFKKILALLVLTTAFIACDGVPDKTDDDGAEYDGPPKQIISVKDAKSMYDSYTDRRSTIIKKYEEEQDSTEKFYPTRYGKYDFETMKHYMAYLEDQAKMAKVNKSSGSMVTQITTSLMKRPECLIRRGERSSNKRV